MRKRVYPKNSDRIYVAKVDIKKGIQSNTESCPVAHALKRRLSGSQEVHVLGTGICEVGSRRYRLCKKAKKFVRAFDQGHEVEPFHMYLTRRP